MDILLHLQVVFIVLNVTIYTLTHPKWTWNIVKGLRQYVKNQGDFLDTDFYKITMGQLVWRYFPDITCRYTLTLRKDIAFPKGFDKKLRLRVDHYAEHNHSISQNQFNWLNRLPFIASDYLAFLLDPTKPKIFPRHVIIRQIGSKLFVEIVGPWYLTIFWEVPLMQMISGLYFEETHAKPDGISWIVRAWNKGRILKRIGALVAEFGTRRRFSFWVQFTVLYLLIVAFKMCRGAGKLVGTSNVFLAQLFNLTPIGTMAHELFMVVGAIYGYDKANEIVVYLWHEEFGDSLGYFLPDNYGSEYFYFGEDQTPSGQRSGTVHRKGGIDRTKALIFTGPRQDSGEFPQGVKSFIDLTIRFYRSIGLEAKQIARKIIVFSDSLNIDKIKVLLDYCQRVGIGASFGIGTNLTNDVGVEHINMVIKAYEAWITGAEDDRRGCVKTSDEDGKITGEPEAVEQVKIWKATGQKTWKPPLRTNMPHRHEHGYSVAA